MQMVSAIEAVSTRPLAYDFHALLVSMLPRLRVQAVSLTRNRADADDLVQGAVTSALAARESFTPGTNFGAWMFRILRNRFISNVRARRINVELDEVPSSTFVRPGSQEDSLVLGELAKHMARLPAEQRTALVMVAIQGMSYEEVGAAMECPAGTAKARVCRARDTLHRLLMGEERGVAVPSLASGRPRQSGARKRPSLLGRGLERPAGLAAGPAA
jgi:RNA polymerase sigma-70 factor (ECF subfamily)